MRFVNTLCALTCLHGSPIRAASNRQTGLLREVSRGRVADRSGDFQSRAGERTSRLGGYDCVGPGYPLMRIADVARSHIYVLT